MNDRYRSQGYQQGDRDRTPRTSRQDEQFSVGSDNQNGDGGWRTQENERWQSGQDFDRGHGRNDPFDQRDWRRSPGGSDTSGLDDYDRSFGGAKDGQRERYGRSGTSYGGEYSQSRNTTGYGDDLYGAGSGRFGLSTYSSAGYGSGTRIPPRQYNRDDRGFFDRASDEVMSWFGDDDAARRRQLDSREDHRGKGPAGYTRSNERLLEDANERLMHDSAIDASNITVTCEDNEITLTGTVNSRSAKRRAEDIVDDISGVKHVQNNLRVESTGSNYYSGTSTLTDS